LVIAYQSALNSGLTLTDENNFSRKRERTRITVTGLIVRLEMEENVIDTPAVEKDDRLNMTQIQLNDVIKREREAAARKAGDSVRREVEEKYASELQSLKQRQTQELDPEEMYSKFEERMMGNLQKKQADAQRLDKAKQISDMYHEKVKKGSELYDDFEEILAEFDPEAFPEIAVLASEHDNTHDLIRELVQNPTKMSAIIQLADRPGGAPLARKAMRQLSESIKANQDAMSQRQPNAPFSKVRASNIGGVDAMPESVADLRKLKFLKG